jgi:hypothetical protein
MVGQGGWNEKLILLLKLPNFFQLRCQAHAQRAFWIHTIQERFSFGQGGICNALTIEQLSPEGCHVTFVHYAPSSLLVKNLGFRDSSGSGSFNYFSQYNSTRHDAQQRLTLNAEGFRSVLREFENLMETNACRHP